MRQKRTPSYRRHRASNRAYVEFDGHRIYLGRYGSPESREEYDRLIAEWLSNGRKLPVSYRRCLKLAFHISTPWCS